MASLREQLREWVKDEDRLFSLILRLLEEHPKAITFPERVIADLKALRLDPVEQLAKVEEAENEDTLEALWRFATNFNASRRVRVAMAIWAAEYLSPPNEDLYSFFHIFLNSYNMESRTPDLQR